MKIVSKLLRGFALLATASSVFLVVGTESLYRNVIEDLQPPPAVVLRVPKRVRECLWVAQGGNAPVDTPRIQPWTVLGRIGWAWLPTKAAAPSPGVPHLAAQIARQWVARRPPHQNLTFESHLWAAEVWVSRNLSVDDQLAYLAQESYLGQGVVGFDEGARVFFGKPLAGLSIQETATLCAISALPVDERPMGAPEILVQKRAWILQRLHAEGFLPGTHMANLAR